MQKQLLQIFLMLIFIGTGLESYGQQNIGNLLVKNRYKGDQYFLDLYFEQAIKYYKLALRKNVNDETLKLKIADSYRLLSDYSEAGSWYEGVMALHPEDQKPIYKYHYANMLISAEKYDEALQWLEQYHKEVPDDSRASKKIHALENMPVFFMDSSITAIKSLPFNSKYSEMGPVVHDGKLLFLSARPSKNALVDQDYLREVDLYNLYEIKYDSSGGWGTIDLFDKVVNTPFHEGPISFYNGEEKFILTRSNYLNKRQQTDPHGKTRLQLFTVTKTGNIWANIQPFELNDVTYSLAHPALSKTNDTLFFASDMPGGFGGMDLYMTVNSGDGWRDPVNLGPQVNTEGNELFPNYVSGRLFFASDGLGGLGGLDIFKATISLNGASKVINMGVPINSPMDDFSFTIDPFTKSGYFTSNRAGGRGSDDIYYFEQYAQVLNGIVIQEQDRAPLPGVQINLYRGSYVIATTLTGGDGTFKFFLPLDEDFKITAEKDEHSFKTDLALTTKGSRVDMDTLLIEMHKHDFFARGVVYDNKTHEGLYDAQVILTDKSNREADTVDTGFDGSYSFVIEPGRNYVIRVEKARFSSDSVEINTHAISKGVITNDFVIDEKYIDKQVVFFDYDKYELRSDGEPELKKVLEVAKRYPKDWVIIGAHADSRGSKEYNQGLSDKRAKSVLDFFVRNGVSVDRIIARGFGEGLIINRCVDGVNCREEDHSKNRRAEITVSEKRPEEKPDNRGF